MGDAHEVIVHHVGEVIGGVAVGLDEDLVLQLGVVHLDMAVDRVVKGGDPLAGHLLPDDIGQPGVELLLHLFGRKVAAVAVVPAHRGPGGHLVGPHLLEPLGGAEAVVGLARFDQLLGVLLEHAHPLALHIGAHRAADVGALVPDKAGLAQGIVDDVHRALDIALLVGILDAQDKGTALAFGLEVGVEGGAQVAHVHIAGGAGGKAGADGVGHLVQSPISRYGGPGGLRHLPRRGCSRPISVSRRAGFVNPKGNPKGAAAGHFSAPLSIDPPAAACYNSVHIHIVKF